MSDSSSPLNQKADEALGIPAIVEAADLVLTDTPDELSVLTYVGYFKAWTESGKSSNAFCSGNEPNASFFADPYRCMVTGRGIEAPELGVTNQFLVSIYSNVSKEPLVLKDDQMKVTSMNHALMLRALNPNPIMRVCRISTSSCIMKASRSP